MGNCFSKSKESKPQAITNENKETPQVDVGDIGDVHDSIKEEDVRDYDDLNQQLQEFGDKYPSPSLSAGTNYLEFLKPGRSSIDSVNEICKVEFPLTSETARKFCEQFCERINRMHKDPRDNHWKQWTKKSLGVIFSDDVDITFMDQYMDDLDEVVTVYQQMQKAWHSRSSTVTMLGFDIISVTFDEDVTYKTWDKQELKITYTWKINIDEEGKVKDQEYINPNREDFDRYNAVVTSYLAQADQ